MLEVCDFEKARRGAVTPTSPGKTRITIRLDNEVLQWFKDQVHQVPGHELRQYRGSIQIGHVASRNETWLTPPVVQPAIPYDPTMIPVAPRQDHGP